MLEIRFNIIYDFIPFNSLERTLQVSLKIRAFSPECSLHASLIYFPPFPRYFVTQLLANLFNFPHLLQSILRFWHQRRKIYKLGSSFVSYTSSLSILGGKCACMGSNEFFSYAGIHLSRLYRFQESW